MRIEAAHAWVERFPLVRPYTIAFKHFEAVENVIVCLRASSGKLGFGAASPEAHVTGETFAACREALLGSGLDWLLGCNLENLPPFEARFAALPAARAAVEIALYDLLAQERGLPLVEMLGRVHPGLPTSVTIGIQPLESALAEAEEYLGRGFRILKVKGGQVLEEDIELLARLREKVGPAVRIRVDPNQGYTASQVLHFVRSTEHLELEFLEQPMAAQDVEALRALPRSVRRRIAADESLLGESDAHALLSPEPACGIFNLKLMKCGGIGPALRIASLAELGGVELMWGCMDESIVSIAAALHTALASPATRYLDLDGSLDLARDVVSGGFVLEDGYLYPLELPGLGVQPL